jgi:hypothetical protein
MIDKFFLRYTRNRNLAKIKIPLQNDLFRYPNNSIDIPGYASGHVILVVILIGKK